ncbi:MAG TPA: aspartate kinase [Bacillota bacterium]|nr:aspartate kinase [Bacillota bacterium]
MSIYVAKFGGTSLADATQFRKVHSIVTSNPARCYIVPSAPGKRSSDDYKITDLLYLCHAHVKQAIPFDDVFKIISERYLGICSELGLKLDLQPVLAEIKQKISEGISADYVASRGEYLSGLIMAELLHYEFIDPSAAIFFNEAGLLDLKKTQKILGERLSSAKQAVIPGFYGATPTGAVKTFSRGGSDITGAIVARCANADLYENWTDVSGFLMADPRIVKNPKPIEKVTYRELRELAYMGATVLHEEAIFPVREVGIPINIKNTNQPEHPGTIIVNEAPPSDTITGIAGKREFTIIALEKAMMNTELGFGRKLLSILEANSISFEHLPSGIDTVSVVIADSQLKGKLDALLEEIKQQCKPDSLEVYPNIALIATVGRGMVYTPGIAAKLFTALAQANVNVRMIDQGSSELNIIVGVQTNDFEKAVQTIYQAFVK